MLDFCFLVRFVGVLNQEHLDLKQFCNLKLISLFVVENLGK